MKYQITFELVTHEEIPRPSLKEIAAEAARGMMEYGAIYSVEHRWRRRGACGQLYHARDCECAGEGGDR